MNKELIEKLKAIRKDLVAFQAQAKVGDAKKLAELVQEKGQALGQNYFELMPYMTVDQKMTFDHSAGHIVASAGIYLKMDKTFHIAALVEKHVPPLLADLDDIAENLKSERTQPREP